MSEVRISPNDKATNEWLDRQKDSTKKMYKSCWLYFLEYTKMTGDEILASKKEDDSNAWEQRVLDFKEWLTKECITRRTRKKEASKQKHPNEGTASTVAAAVRGFFSFHRQDLKFRPIEARHLEEAEPVYEDYRFSRDDLKRMSDVAKLTEKYVIVAGKSFGLRAGDFLALVRGDLEAYLDREVPISIGKYQTEKEKEPAYPFIDRDAKPVIKLMLQKMDREGRTDPEEPMLNYKHTVELTRIVRRVAERAGIKHGSKRIRFHCLRKFLIDRLSSFMSESKWKQVVGKAISEGAYVSPDLLRKDYRRTMSETCFTTEDLAAKTQIEVARAILKAAGLDADALLRREMAKRMMTEKEKAEFLTRKAAEVIAKERSKPTQQIVDESELANHLSHGWRLAGVLHNGKVVIETA